MIETELLKHYNSFLMSQCCFVGHCFLRKQWDSGFNFNSKVYFLAKKFFSKILETKNYTGNRMEQHEQCLKTEAQSQAAGISCLLNHTGQGQGWCWQSLASIIMKNMEMHTGTHKTQQPVKWCQPLCVCVPEREVALCKMLLCFSWKVSVVGVN